MLYNAKFFLRLFYQKIFSPNLKNSKKQISKKILEDSLAKSKSTIASMKSPAIQIAVLLPDVSERGINIIKEFEGFKNSPYICPGGENTIGYGHVILKDEKYLKISEPKAVELLRKDLRFVKADVRWLVKVKLNDDQFSAIVSLTYNIGIGKLKTSTLLRYVNLELHHQVPREFRRFIYANGKILKGLKRRRKIEADLYQSIYKTN